MGKLQTRIKRRKPSAAMVVACAALFFSLGGGSFAAAALTSGSRLQVESRAGATLLVRPHESTFATARCPRGTKPVGGGYNASDFGLGSLGGDPDTLSVYDSAPSAHGWVIAATVLGTAPVSVRAIVTCAGS